MGHHDVTWADKKLYNSSQMSSEAAWLAWDTQKCKIAAP